MALNPLFERGVEAGQRAEHERPRLGGEQTIRRAHAVQPVSVLQTEYSLFERDVEVLFPVLHELGTGFVPYSPLGRGFLTGTARPAGQYDASDLRSRDPRWQRATTSATSRRPPS